MSKQYQKKTILKVVPALNSGGVERGIVEIARQVVESGDNSIIVSSGGKLVPQLEAAGAKHIELNVASKNPFTIWRNIQKLVDIIKEHNVDIVHVHSRAPAWSCYKAAKITGARFVTTFHGIYNFYDPIKKYYNSIMTKGEVVIAVSEFVKKHIIENYNIDSKKIKVIHRGVDYEDFMPENFTEKDKEEYKDKYNAPLFTPILLLPARMTRWKGHLILIDALKEIKDISFYCLLVGDMSKHPDYVEEIKDRIYKNRIQNRVQLFNDEINVSKLYNIADIVLSTSIEPEAFGRTIIEAQSMKKLVVATKLGGVLETVEDGVTGFHVQPKDVQDLAQKIKHAISLIDSDEYNRITEQARETVKSKFSLELMISQVLDVYKSL